MLKYIFFEEKNYDILERDSKNKHTNENEDSKPFSFNDSMSLYNSWFLLFGGEDD